MGAKRLLAVWAHPDDEAFGPVGTLCLAHERGWQTAIVTATRGDAGKDDRVTLQPGQTLGDLRAAELRAAAAVVGVDRIDVWHYGDGALQNVPPDELTARIADVIRSWRPAIVLTFGPDGITGYPDHVAIGQATERAFHQLRAERGSDGPQRLYYVTTRMDQTIEHPMGDAPKPQTPTTVIDVSTYEATKREALARHASQQADWEPMLADHDWLTVDHFVRAFPPFAPHQSLETTIFDE